MGSIEFAQSAETIDSTSTWQKPPERSSADYDRGRPVWDAADARTDAMVNAPCVAGATADRLPVCILR